MKKLTNKKTQIQIALAYAKKGIAVFPCNANKAPIIKGGFRNASTNQKQIEEWWTKNPNALIGSPNDKFTVLDVDDYGLCQVGQMLTDEAHSLIKNENIVKEDTMQVRTASGGTHYYFKKDDDIKRSIKALPNIDVLGSGGYTILPDQKNYICLTSDEPWEAITKVKKLNAIKLAMLVDENEEKTDTATVLQKIQKAGGYTASQARRMPSRQVNNSPSIKREEVSVSSQVANAGFKVFTNRETDSISFSIGEGMYQQGERHFKINPKAKVLDEETKTFKLKRGELTQEKIFELFYNIEVQTLVGKFLGLDVPNGTSNSTRQRSVLPNHIDRRPSMSVRWVEETHLVARDHSNHFSDKHNQTDYDVIRLYTTMAYGTATPRFSTGERNMWFLKLLYDAGILNISEVVDTLATNEFETPSLKKLVEGVQLLGAFKNSYIEYDGYTAFSDRFAAGWVGLSPNTVNKAKQEAIAKGHLLFVQEVNCDVENEDFNLNVTRGLVVRSNKHGKLDLSASLSNERAYRHKRKELITSMSAEKDGEGVATDTNQTDTHRSSNTVSSKESKEIATPKFRTTDKNRSVSSNDEANNQPVKNTSNNAGREFIERLMVKSRNARLEKLKIKEENNSTRDVSHRVHADEENIKEKVKSSKEIYERLKITQGDSQWVYTIEENNIIVEKIENEPNSALRYWEQAVPDKYHQRNRIFIGGLDP